MTAPIDPKQLLRRQAMETRRAASARLGTSAGERFAAHFLAALNIPADGVIAGYWPMGEEADPRPLLDALAQRGHPLALPVVEARAAPLVFRRWAPGEPLESGPHATFHPLLSAPEVTPALLLVPLLAFDRQGGRLGYGGGYYDRTLEGLRRTRSVVAVGLAFAQQQLPTLPCASHDQRLDWIVTEEGAMETKE